MVDKEDHLYKDIFDVIEDNVKEDYKNVTAEMPYDEVYLKKFENMPPGRRFTEDELEYITNKAFRPLRCQQIYELDHSEGDYYRKISSVNERNTEEFWKQTIDNMAPYDFQKEFHDNLLEKHLGIISEAEFDRRQFKRILKMRYEK